MRNIIHKVLSLAIITSIVSTTVFFDTFFTSLPAEAALDSSVNQYALSLGPVTGSATANYIYSAVLNPVGSGRTVVISRIRIHSAARAAATYQNLDVRRITTLTAGTQIVAADIPKKNSGSSNSVVDARTAIGTTGVTFSGNTDSRLLSTVAAGTTNALFGIADVTFKSGEKVVLAPGEGLALYQTAAGDTDQRVTLDLEWEEVASAPSAQDEYMLSYQRTENAAATDYKYATFFNPSGSGKTVVVRRLNVDIVADNTAVYTNDIYVRRISAASGGTQITAANIPKKNSASANSIIDARYTGVTATLSGTADSALMRLVPPGAAAQYASQDIYFGDNDEKIVLAPGEGIALVSSAAGDIDQLTRWTIEWQETNNAPSAQGEYMLGFQESAFAAAANNAYQTLFNPASSGKYFLVKRIFARVVSTAGAVYQPISVRRISAASGGTQIAASSIPEKNNASSVSVAEARYTNPTITGVGTADNRIMTITGTGAIGQYHGEDEAYFSDISPLVLRAGEGIMLYTEAAGSANQRVTLYVEWQETTTNPTALSRYVASTGSVSGSATANYVYGSMFNPTGSGVYAAIRRVSIIADTVNTAVYVPLSLRRTTNGVSGGTQIAVADLNEKDSAGSVSAMHVRRAGATVTFAGDVNSRILSVVTPGAVSSAAAPQRYSRVVKTFEPESLVLAPGEGVALYQEAAGDTDFRISMVVEWDESNTLPRYEGLFTTTFNAPGSTVAGAVFASFFNLAASGKNILLRGASMYAIRTGAQTAPGGQTINFHKISAASGATQVAVANLPKRNSGTATSIADVRINDPAGTLLGGATGRIGQMVVPAAVGGSSNFQSIVFSRGNDLLLRPGEGVVLYQESAPGDALTRYILSLDWEETSVTQDSYRLFINADDTVGGSAITAQNTAATLPFSGSSFRLRQLFNNDGGVLWQNADQFKLQFSAKSGACDTAFSGETYVDVTNATVMAWNNNPTPSNGDFALVNSSDPTSTRAIVRETYVEGNSFTNASSTLVYPGDAMLWDFSLKDNGAPLNTSYCFRVVRNSGSTLESYAVIPEVITAPTANILPVASAVSIDSGAASVNLIESTTKTVTCVGTVTDNNGFADIQSVTADLYRTSLGTSSPLDVNNHYRLSGDTQCIPSGGSGTSETYTCSFPVWFHADPTDVGSPNSADTWSCTMTPVDTVATGTPATDTIEMASLYAIDVTPTISYGTLSPNTNTGSVNATTTITNTGNITTNLALSGTNMTSGGNTIAVGSQKYATTNFAYTSGGVALTTTPTSLALGLAKKVISTTTAPVYWGIGVPNGSPIGSYSGSITVTAGP